MSHCDDDDDDDDEEFGSYDTNWDIHYSHSSYQHRQREWVESSKKTYTVLEHFGLRIHLVYMGYIYWHLPY